MKLNPATEQLLTLAATIPCLARKLGVRLVNEPDTPCLRYSPDVPWLVERHGELAFDPDKLHRCIGPWSDGEWLCAMFLLNVWNPANAKAKRWHFNLMDFLQTADPANRDALIQWMHNPVFP